MDAPTQAPTARYFSQLELTSARFCLLADITMLTLGGKLKLRERISARLGDVLSALYLGSAVLKRFHASSCPEEDWPLLEYCMQENLYMAQEQLLAVMDNFPHPLLGVLLKRVLFPYGRRQRPPSDTLAGKAAQVIMRADDARERLTRGVYVPVAEDEALARLDKALETGTLAQPVLQLIRGAMRDGRLSRGDPEEAVNEALERGVIDAAQAEQVRVAMVARQRVIHVDDFPPELFTREHSAWADTETTPAQSTS